MQPTAAAEMALNLNAPSMQPSCAIYSVLLAFQLIKTPPDVTMMVPRCEALPGRCTLQLPTEPIVSPLNTLMMPSIHCRHNAKRLQASACLYTKLSPSVLYGGQRRCRTSSNDISQNKNKHQYAFYVGSLR